MLQSVSVYSSICISVLLCEKMESIDVDKELKSKKDEDYNEIDVKRLLFLGILRWSKAIDRDKKLYRSDVWQVFEHLYTEKDKRILHWYKCIYCEILNVILKTNGNSQLTNHGCYVKYKKNKEETPKENQVVAEPKEISAVEITKQVEKSVRENEITIDIDCLAETFQNAMQIAFKKAPVSSQNIKKILPLNNDW